MRRMEFSAYSCGRLKHELFTSQCYEKLKFILQLELMLLMGKPGKV